MKFTFLDVGKDNLIGIIMSSHFLADEFSKFGTSLLHGALIFFHGGVFVIVVLLIISKSRFGGNAAKNERNFFTILNEIFLNKKKSFSEGEEILASFTYT